MPGTRTVPYQVVGDHLMVLRGNPFRIREAADLSGRVASVTSGSSAERFAHDLNRAFEEAGRAPMHVHSFPEDRWTHFPVSMGHAQGYFTRTVSAVAVSADPESRNRLVEGVFRPLREVGFAIRADNDKLHHAVEHAVAAMVATGKYPPPARGPRPAGRSLALPVVSGNNHERVPASLFPVMAGLVPAIHEVTPVIARCDEMPGTSPGMTVVRIGGVGAIHPSAAGRARRAGRRRYSSRSAP